MIILRNPFRKINRVYIINSSRQDSYKDIEDAIYSLDIKPYYYWKLVSRIYHDIDSVRSLNIKLKLYIQILFSEYILIPQYNSVEITDKVFLYEMKIAGLFRKEIRWL